MAVTIHHKQTEAYDFLKNHKVGVLATVDPNGDPHAAAVYYDIDKDLTITFITRARTKKADNLRRHDHAMLVVYQADTQTTVQISGTATEVTDMMETNAIFTKVIYTSLDTSDTAVPPISKLQEGDYVAFRLKPSEVRMAAFRQAHAGDYNDIFTIIETPTER